MCGASLLAHSIAHHHTCALSCMQVLRGNRRWFEGVSLVVISNTLWVGERVPCLTYGMRGMISLSIEVQLFHLFAFQVIIEPPRRTDPSVGWGQWLCAAVGCIVQWTRINVFHELVF